MDLDFAEVLLEVVNRRASDLHLSAGAPPMVRVRGRLTALEGYPALTPTDTREIVYSILSNAQRQKLENDWQIDFAYQIPGRARFRVNAYFQRSALGAAFRLIPFEVAPLESLGLPPAVADFAKRPRGLVLVTGPTGSGKSTTLASLIDVINESREEHIMTIEDPIEFLHHHKKCIVNQREIGSDATSFADALKAALRQDPDVILVGEMRDLETIGTAITAAETGHLVFATLHTQDTPQTLDRIIDVFPASQQGQIRAQLSVALQGIMTQMLLPTADGAGRCVAAEVLVPTPAVRNLIRESKSHQIYSVLQTGGAHGMQTMDAALAQLVRSGKITRHLAESRAHSLEELRRLMGVRPPIRWRHERWPPTSSKRRISRVSPRAGKSKPSPSRTSPSSSRAAAWSLSTSHTSTAPGSSTSSSSPE
jgi:twitching motility protein PilT